MKLKCTRKVRRVIDFMIKNQRECPLLSRILDCSFHRIVNCPIAFLTLEFDSRGDVTPWDINKLIY